MKQFMAYLDEESELLRQESRRLMADDRRDEGDFAKIRANVYSICKSVFQVLEAQKARTKIVGLRVEWEAALSAAREHNDVKKAVVEEIKLETLGKIEAALNSMEEV